MWKDGQKLPKIALNCPKWSDMVHNRRKWAKITNNYPKLSMSTIVDHCGSLMVILDHFGPFWTVLDQLGPQRAILGNFGPFCLNSSGAYENFKIIKRWLRLSNVLIIGPRKSLGQCKLINFILQKKWILFADHCW